MRRWRTSRTCRSASTGLRAGIGSRRSCPAAALYGFDPQEHPRLGVYYVVRDQELGDQFLSVNWDFPFGDDPSLWAVLELVR